MVYNKNTTSITTYKKDVECTHDQLKAIIKHGVPVQLLLITTNSYFSHVLHVIT